jgi:hypothetical protein
MRPIIGPLPQQIRTIAYDPSLKLIAVGYGSQVSIYTIGSLGLVWVLLDSIPEPHEGAGVAALVNSVFFYGHPVRKLFAGRAAAGWT